MRNDRLTIIVILISVLVLAVPIVSDSSEASVTKSANGVNILVGISLALHDLYLKNAV